MEMDSELVTEFIHRQANVLNDLMARTILLDTQLAIAGQKLEAAAVYSSSLVEALKVKDIEAEQLRNELLARSREIEYLRIDLRNLNPSANINIASEE